MSDSSGETTATELELEVTALAAGGDGVARDGGGRVTFVPRTAVGDRVWVRLVKETKSFARAEVVELIEPSPDRVEPPCEYFRAGCGGCQWQHISRPAQLAAKQAIVAGALRQLTGLVVEPIADPAPPYGWRRRARFHVAVGNVGLYATASHRVIPIVHCPQLEPALDAAMAVVASSSPPDGELTLVRGANGAIAVGVERMWRGATPLIGRAGIVGVIADEKRHGDPIVEIEPGLFGSPEDFAQASAAGNAAMIAIVRAALGQGPGELLELYAGAGNFTRGFVEDRWEVLATDFAAPPRPIAGARFETGTAERVLHRSKGPFDAIVLDPPRTGAAEAIEGIIRHAPKTIVYVSCDPATLGRDAGHLVAAGYRAERAWPIDVMPQTSHVEVVMKLTASV
jgi:23S rRNA (uracil1939-C5)-methyltransferase